MDAHLDSRLQAILDAAETAAIHAGGDIDILPIRNEIEDAENRLAEHTRELHDSLADQVASNRQAIQRLQSSVDELAEAVESLRAELPG